MTTKWWSRLWAMNFYLFIYFFTDLKFCNLAICRTETRKWSIFFFFPKSDFELRPRGQFLMKIVWRLLFLDLSVGTWLCVVHPQAVTVCTCSSSFPFLPFPPSPLSFTLPASFTPPPSTFLLTTLYSLHPPLPKRTTQPLSFCNLFNPHLFVCVCVVNPWWWVCV